MHSCTSESSPPLRNRGADSIYSGAPLTTPLTVSANSSTVVLSASVLPSMSATVASTTTTQKSASPGTVATSTAAATSKTSQASQASQGSGAVATPRILDWVVAALGAQAILL